MRMEMLKAVGLISSRNLRVFVSDCQFLSITFKLFISWVSPVASPLNDLLNLFLALSLTVETSITTADVTFHHTNPSRIVRYEAYVNSLGGNKCTVAAKVNDPKCTLRGIGEAVEFYVVARACFAGNDNCEPPIEVKSRTKLRGSSLWPRNSKIRKQTVTPDNGSILNFLFRVDARDLRFEVLSPTSLKATVIPPDNSAADYAVVHFRNPEHSGYCSVYNPPYSCIYRELKPGQEYDFVYSLGAMPGAGFDIISKDRYKSFVMPKG